MAALKSRSLLLVLLSVLVFSFSSCEASHFLGGWDPIHKLNDPLVVEIAKFAVAEHNKQAKAALEFVTVVKGETELVAGLNYKLIISAKDGGAAAPAAAALTKNYEAVVYDVPWGKERELTSFKEIKLLLAKEGEDEGQRRPRRGNDDEERKRRHAVANQAI
ncbi:hypothetical protein BUALT_Bualt03G0086900 [Buddleja alternifolia]|uniref:Cystatin domain-containing protein n=1 Tax=Buddleja alternifolia TaxID=168488 RepID=A0AAV6XTC5_9LAMI|nr:hypothetical protein BUALT_Bualt03G0086900 [Buddleja alternifolia]